AIQVQEYLLPGDKLLLDFSILFNRVKEYLYPDRLFPKMGIMTLHGMAGIGKTTLMKKLFDDPSILWRFDCCAWVNVGSKYQSQQILVDVLAQIYHYIDRDAIDAEDGKLAADLCGQLSYKKCLIILDDLWSQEPVHYLKRFLPADIKGELMVTTRLMTKVAFFGPCDRMMKMQLLNKDESWDLLREKVFGKMSCSFQLEIVGKKIADNCEGLPLLILAVADHLSKSEITLEYWKEVANHNETHVVMVNARNELSKALLPSYENLPQHLKACFLYMGVFPFNCKISTSKLTKLWSIEGFLEPNPSQTVEDCAARYLKDLVQENVVMDRQKSSDLINNKRYGLHSVFWNLSCNEAMKSNFFHNLNTYIDHSSMGSSTSIQNPHHRLCIRKSILLGFKQVYDAVGSYSTWRALLCTGAPHQYPVPLYIGSKLLKVLDALSVRLYEFPIEVVELIHLRYLALTCNGTLPSSISKLRKNLQFFIVRQHLSIKSSGNSSYLLPKEIWDMKALEHLQISGSKLPNPPPNSGACLPNLGSLLDVSVQSCTKRVLKRIPNLKKLGIQIELAPNDDNENSKNPFGCLNRISRLRKLESLKCVVVNPELMSDVVAPPAPRSMFPSGLKKLSLSGLGYPWEYMSIIGKLRNLQVLKLRCYAFEGPAWEIDSTSFSQLKFLSIEDTDLVRWDIRMPNEVCSLKHISINNCYNLEQLPSYLSVSVEKIEVVESHPLAEDWAKEMKYKNWETLRLKILEILIHSSWN
ncbi:hypothetical protein C2S53_016819, partial [Perilla frutescens var. hirtella]